MIFSTVNAQNIVQKAAENSSGGLGEFFREFFTAIPLWIGAAVVFIVAIIVANFAKRIVRFRLAKQQTNQEVMILVERSTHVLIVILGLIIAFKIVNIDITTLFGFMGLGIGFALKDVLSNFFAGILILTQHKFKIGDIVKVENYHGTITEIDSRSTQIRSFDGTNLIIPNATMINAVVENFTANSFRRINLEVGVHYSTPLNISIQTALQSLRSSQNIVPEPVPVAIATEFSDSAITLKLSFWVESTSNWLEVRSQIIQKLKLDFDKNNIKIPFPIRTLRIDQNDKNLMQALHLPSGKVRENNQNVTVNQTQNNNLNPNQTQNNNLNPNQNKV